MFRKNMRLQKSLESMTKFEKRAGVHLQQKRQEEWAECSEKERTPGKEFFLSLA